MKKYLVIGNPVEHSLSPKLHNYWIKANKISKSSFEFQVLYGVPMQGRLEQLINQGHKVRIYVPYGKDWFDYSVRRLKENPNILKYVLKNFLKGN